MKRNFLYLAAMASVVALGACADKQNTQTVSDHSDIDKVYTGVLPSADADGVRYTVLMDYDDDNNGGEYDMVQTYFTTDSVGNINDIATFVSDGDFTVATSDTGKKYLKFSGDGSGEMYFLNHSDSTIGRTG
ncbi:MAG: copper resistance protein NlpE N-terminal domain-containing protein [Muribaculaceae bacterium]|nr:copper resistance protein NlpE N-terminal domain-containing protein [Muribaculaceae bacterium]